MYMDLGFPRLTAVEQTEVGSTSRQSHIKEGVREPVCNKNYSQQSMTQESTKTWSRLSDASSKLIRINVLFLRDHPSFGDSCFTYKTSNKLDVLWRTVEIIP